ncbi:hypothetical protein [Streptomyces sp. NPDC002463]|uniref:hypothetical protein n=1 Tax=Streptomyces sp. NPDC002463 TaxID=3364645 RepID=UPI0036C192EC
MMRLQADTRNGDDWILRTLADLCLAQGRPEDGLAEYLIDLGRVEEAMAVVPHRDKPHPSQPSTNAARSEEPPF